MTDAERLASRGLSAVPFDHTQAKCNGSRSNITGRDYPMCVTCGRLTLRPNAPVKGRVFLFRGEADCEHWMPNHDPTMRPDKAGPSPLVPQAATNETGQQ